jgi:polyisoprenoid-binding protein YceI
VRDLNGRDALVCKVRASLPLASLSAAKAEGHEICYRLDQRAGPIEFSVDQCGLFEASGRVDRYTARLVLDRRAPLGLRAELELDASSIVLLVGERRAAPFAPSFDAAAHPRIGFHSSSLSQTGAATYVMRGLVEIAGVTTLETLDAEFVGRHVDPITGTHVAEAEIGCRLSGSAFGLLPGQTFLGDRIELRVSARLELDG